MLTHKPGSPWSRHQRHLLTAPLGVDDPLPVDGRGYPLYGSDTFAPWTGKGSPLHTLHPDADDDLMPHVRWVDHPRIEHVDGNRVWVCHPYHLDADAFADFQTLEQAGWTVWVSGKSNYYPGNTVRVEVWREPKPEVAQ